jgi:Family of unknown function (DUF5683)
MGSGGPRGLQILQSGAKNIRGGFDSHTFPPQSSIARFVVSIAVAGVLASAISERAIADMQEPAAAPAPDAQADKDDAGAAQPAPPPTTGPRYRVSPTRATLQSMVVPGLGQYRAGARVRGAVAFALESYLVTRTLIEHDRAGDDRDRAEEAGMAGDVAAESEFAASADLHEERRGELLFWTGIAHMFNMLDAYVAAHLSLVDDEIDSVERLTFNASPSLGGGETLTVTWSF